MNIKIIDENGIDVGCLRRDLAVKYGLRHQIASVLIYSDTDHTVLLQRRNEKKTSCPGMWDKSAGGHVDAHEDSISAVIRETKEELGISLIQNELKLLGKYNTDDKLTDGYLRRQTLDFIYNTKPKKLKIIIQPEELEQVEWVKIYELKKILTTDKLNPKYKSHDLTKGLIRALNLLIIDLKL